MQIQAATIKRRAAKRKTGYQSPAGEEARLLTPELIIAIEGATLSAGDMVEWSVGAATGKAALRQLAGAPGFRAWRACCHGTVRRVVRYFVERGMRPAGMPEADAVWVYVVRHVGGEA